MAIRCERRIRWDAAHRIPGHGGKCKDLHGHGYQAVLTAEARQLDELGMVVDFGILKGFQLWVDEHWDHGTLLWEKDLEALAVLNQLGGKVFRLPFRPTAERLAQYLLETVGPKVLSAAGIEVVKVRVEETPNCSAEVSHA